MKLKYTLLTIALPLCLAGCNGSDDEEDTSLNADVNTPAIPVLEEEGSLHIFNVQAFDQDPTDITPTRAFIANFTMPSVTREPEDDEEDEINDLGWTEDKWADSTRSWASIQNPELDSRFEDLRSYRVLKDNTLPAATTTLNRPIFEADDEENVFERYLGVTFVWDLDNLTDDTGEQVGGKEIADYQKYNDYDILPHAEIWGDDINFSSDAKIYGASRSVAEDVVTIEAVDSGSGFSMGAAQLPDTRGRATLDDALEIYPVSGSKRLAYRFTVNYGSVELSSYKGNAVRNETDNVFYITFDTITKEAKLFTSASGSGDPSTVGYTEHLDQSYIELNTNDLPEGERKLLGLPTYFQPIIAGPFSTDGSTLTDTADNTYYFGKRYIKTDNDNRLKLDPVLFLNPEAKADVRSAFEKWQDERYDELEN